MPVRPLAPLTPLIFPRPRRRSGEVQPSLMDLREFAIVSRGRTAIAAALRQERIGTGDEVLLPAYHCVEMVNAIRSVGATPGYYRIGEDLQIHLRDVTAVATARTKAVLVPHLFSVRQPQSLFDAAKANTGWLIIEDCAHSFFGSRGSAGIGVSGHYAVGSIAKFFPTLWGGLLGSDTRHVATCEAGGSIVFQAKLMANAVERAAQYGRLGPLSTVVSRGLQAASTVRHGGLRAQVQEQGSNDRVHRGDQDDDTSGVGDLTGPPAAGWLRHFIGDRSRFADIADARLAVYRAMRDILGGLGVSILGAGQEPGFPPYVIPVVLTDPERQHAALRLRGVPMYRWEKVAPGECPVADWYSRALVHLPCHQSLTAAEVESIARTFADVVTR